MESGAGAGARAGTRTGPEPGSGPRAGAGVESEVRTGIGSNGRKTGVGTWGKGKHSGAEICW